MGQLIEREPGFVHANEGAELDAAAPLMLTWKGAQTNLQNETGPGSAPARPYQGRLPCSRARLTFTSCNQDLNNQDFEQKATKVTKGDRAAGRASHREVRVVFTIAGAAHAEGRLLNIG
jgi:hypothetical protein